MVPFETLTLVYFAALACAAPTSGAPRARLVEFVLASMTVCAGVVAAAMLAPFDVRAWLAHGYLMLGYWLPARLATSPVAPTPFETWLVRMDSRWRRVAPSLPRPVGVVLELAYLLCYPAVPFAFVVVWTLGTNSDVNRFWVSVLASGFLSYGWLPWLVSRPPRLARTGLDRRGALAGFNVAVLRRISHGLNTFPSGHVAVGVAAAFAVLPVWPLGGAMLMVVALGVAAGAIAGFYHYATDVVFGVVVGVVCSGAVRVLLPGP